MSRHASRLGCMLPVMEQFYTIQGEGFNTGRAAYFIRLGGCDVGCIWCDVKESWDADAHPRQSVAQLVAAVLAYPGRNVVITGGEPLMHDLGPLTDGPARSGLPHLARNLGRTPALGHLGLDMPVAQEVQSAAARGAGRGPRAESGGV